MNLPRTSVNPSLLSKAFHILISGSSERFVLRRSLISPQILTSWKNVLLLMAIFENVHLIHIYEKGKLVVVLIYCDYWYIDIFSHFFLVIYSVFSPFTPFLLSKLKYWGFVVYLFSFHISFFLLLVWRLYSPC